MAWRSADRRPWRTAGRGGRWGPGGLLLVTTVLGLWAPTAVHAQTLFQCSFEQPSRPDLFDKCGMTEVQGQDQFDWSRGQGLTPSGSLHINDDQKTGPKGGQGNSRYYIFIEASDPRLPGDTARLLTPPINYQGEVCLDFYYQMLGADVGSLAIYIQPDGVVRNNIQQVWSQNNVMGEAWFRVRVTARLDRPGGRIEFRGTRGGSRSALGWSGDLAFDSIQVLGGRCEGGTPAPPTAGPPPTNEGPPTFPPNPTTEGPPPDGNEVTLPFACDFETSLCGLRGLSNVNGVYAWTRQRDSTPTIGTGPARAYNGQWYVYVETSEPRQRGDRFILQTLPIRFQGDACVSFAYHMYGDNVDRFLIYVSAGNNPSRIVFDLSGNQGNAWRQASAAVRLSFFDQMYFEVSRGSDIRGDVALDNLRIDPAPCSNSGTPTPQPTPRPTPFPTPGPTLPGGLRRLPWQCGFETDFCGMQQPITDRFDWTRNARSTPTVGTGPDSARSGSYYVFTEASDPRIPGDIALLVSPMFNTQGDVCVEFYYHMFGSGMGTLRVFITRFGASFRVFEINGNQGNQWRFERVTVPNFNYGDQITFEATRGQSYTSDMALDDITIYPGSCSGGVPTPVPVTPVPTPGPPSTGDVFSCSMDDPRLSNQANCRLRQDTREDQLDWTRTSGKTPSGALYSRRLSNGLFPVTGPDGAREGQYYLYIEASGKPRGLVARLFIEGNDVRRGGNACLRFYYSLNGFHMGALRVFTRIGGASRLTKWSLEGDQGVSWQQAVVDIDMSGLSELGYEATTLGEFSGDVAIDDVKVQPGNCESTPSQYVFLCNFETGGGASTICNMEQDRSDRFDWTLRKGPTPSQVTGPDRAFSGEYYMYIEASRPRVRGDFAVLLTPPINRNGDLCAEFMYNMYGFHIGTLEVFTRDGFSADATQWSETGQRGSQWLQGRATLTNFRSGSRIGFRGIRGAEYSGDIAIDSIMFRPGRC